MPQYKFRLLIQGPEHSGEFALPVGTTTIGREQGRELVLPHPLISRQHAKIECSATECYLTDLGSANGTLLNGEVLQPQTPMLLSPAARISIGPFELTFEAELVADAPAPAVTDSGVVSLIDVIPAPPVESVPEKKTGGKKPEEAAAPAAVVKAAPEEKRKKAPPEAKPAAPVDAAPPPPVVPPKPPAPAPVPKPGKGMDGDLLPGLTLHSQRLLEYLPGIYQTDFMSRFLGMFEATLLPIEWTVDNFDLFLDPGTSPEDFLPWLAYWYATIFDSTWSEAQRRTFLTEAHILFARRGTRWALSRLLEIYLGNPSEIVEFSNQDEPFSFVVRLPLREKEINRELIERIVDGNKPAHTMYSLEFKK